MIAKTSRAIFSMRIFLGAVIVIAAVAASACTGEGIDPRTLPDSVRPDYAVFAQRCSKCHSLARPLNSGIQSDAWWQLYVTRMRLQPSSGISVDDQVVILRFLHYYAEAQRNKANGNATADASTAASTTANPEGGAP